MSVKSQNIPTAPSYFVAEVEIHDPAGFKSYADQLHQLSRLSPGV
jgi:hypothetical protein